MDLLKIRKEIRKIKFYLSLRSRLNRLIKEGSISPEKFEGSASPEELNYLMELTKRYNARLIGEIGFNAGFSSFAFLSADPKIKVVSFDIGEHNYVKLAKKYIDKKFPGRHTLIYGDSTETVPKFAQENKGFYFDLVFIDGGHDYEVAKSDILNVKQLCTEKLRWLWMTLCRGCLGDKVLIRPGMKRLGTS